MHIRSVVSSISRGLAYSLGLSLFLAPVAQASGFVFVDPAFHAAPPAPVATPITTVTTTRPPRPGTVPRPNRPVLHGRVTTGLHLENQDISVDIKDGVAKTYIKQTFKNNTNKILAGTYLFPLPEDATFSSFTLHIDGKPVEGKILAAAEARAQYETIVRKMIDPGLLEYVDYKTVRARIFPIPANGTKTVELEYTQLLHPEDGMYKYRFPLKSAGSDAVNETKIAIGLSGRAGLRTIWSPSHVIGTKRKSAHQARVTFNSTGEVQNKDFLLFYTVSGKEIAANLMTHKRDGEKGFFLLSLNPPLKSKRVLAKDIVIMADTSGSMSGEKLAQTKKALKYVVNALNANDRFSLVEFNTDAEAFDGKLLAATKENKERAKAFIDDLEARGGTNIGDALSIGANILATDPTSKRPAYMILMTDGEPTVGMTQQQDLVKSVVSKRDVRLFDFGIGYDINTKLLNKLAELNHGTSQYVGPNESLETALSSFYAKIKNPMLSDVKIAYEGIEVKDIYPRDVKDVFAGTQVMLLGRYKDGGKAAVKLTGMVDGVKKAYSFPLVFAEREATHSYLPRLWAMRRISYLTDVAQNNSETKEVVDEIIALSKRYGIISAYTSFLSTDPKEDRRLRRRPVPVRPMVRGFRSSPTASGLGGARFMFAPNTWSLNRAQRVALAPAGGKSLRAASALPAADGELPSEAAEIGARVTINGRDDSAVKVAAKKERDSFRRALKQAAVKGKMAVEFQKALKDMRTGRALARASATRQMQVIGDKTFYLVNGFWVDSSFESVKEPKVKQIEFGSKEYFELVRKKQAIRKYLGAGQQVILVVGDSCYKIVAPSDVTTTS